MLTVEQKPAGEPKGRQGVQQLSGETAEKAGTDEEGATEAGKCGLL